MSRTRQRGGSTTSPIKRYVRYSGGTGLFSYYDKTKEENVEVESLDVIVLDVRSSITGYHEEKKASITSNLILDTKKEILKVVSFANKKAVDIAEGLYNDIKPAIKEAGGKFTTNIIGLVDFGDGWEISNIQLSGVALNSWIDFVAENENNSYYDYLITFKRGELSKRDKGKNVAVTAKEEAELDAKLKKNPRAARPVWFYTVGFDTVELTSEQIELATEQDEKLQTYFEGVQSAPSTKSSDNEKVTSAPEPEEVEEEEDDDLPF